MSSFITNTTGLPEQTTGSKERASFREGFEKFKAQRKMQKLAQRAKRDAKFEALSPMQKRISKWQGRIYWAGYFVFIFFMAGGPQGWMMHAHMFATTIAVSRVMDVELDGDARRRAVNGALRALDKNSGTVDPWTVDDIDKDADGDAEGDLGFVLSGVGNGKILTVRPDGPADNAGIIKGDVLVSISREEVGEFEVTKQTVLDFIARRLPPGEQIEFKVLREGKEMVFSATVGEFPMVWAHEAGRRDGILHIVLTQFGYGVADQVADVISTAKEKGEVKGVLLDVRGNPGGVAGEVSALAALFVPEDTLVQLKTGRHWGEETVRTEAEERFPEIDIVGVVQNHKSASASEGFAAVVRDLKLGPVVGEVSYGKGSTQAYLTEPGLPNIKVTVARFTGPSGDQIDGVGVAPDSLPPSEDGRVEDWEALINKTMRDMSQSLSKRL